MSDFPVMECEDAEAPEGRTALELLQAIYKNKLAPLSVRMRAASLALPFEAPKLSAMAITSMDQHSFAAALERAITRSNGARSNGVAPAGKVIEHQPSGRRRVS
jgi:hypothetical protein